MSIFSMIYTTLIMPLQLLFEIIFSVANYVLDNPGMAIVALSLMMNILVLPLYRRADAMQEMARDTELKLRDGVKHIKKTFSGDERMIMLQTYYRQNNYKPTDALKGSVSLLLEIPFFMAAYQFLAHLKLLKNVSLGPIADLGAPDGLISLGGLDINLLPILMTAINVISSTIYLKGFPVKTKVQLYAMSAFFLVFLYTSPAGLVFYWTLNNIFSLVKTIFYKLKNPKRAVVILIYIAGAGVVGYGLLAKGAAAVRSEIATLGACVMLMNFLVTYLIKRRKAEGREVKAFTGDYNTTFFMTGAILLTVIVGGLIPSALIESSPQEFVNIVNYYNPLWNVAYTMCMAAGTFLIWMRVFYWLASPRAKAAMDKLVWIMSIAAIVNYMFFGTGLGTLSANLQIEKGVSFGLNEIVVNALVIVLLIVVMLLVIKKWKQQLKSIMVILIMVISIMTVINSTRINSEAKKAHEQLSSSSSEVPYFTLSKHGQNVVVIMLDRALGYMVPYAFNEIPELREQFDGFTYYSNTMSYSSATNYAAPPLFGGYEYTPVEMNKRDEEALVDKHNEALKVMPVMFMEEGYRVTVCDVPYANYQWIPDLSIYDEYPEISTYLLEGNFGETAYYGYEEGVVQKRFFCYSIMKTSPLCLQSFLYNGGAYNLVAHKSDIINQKRDGITKSIGKNPFFLQAYYVLLNLPGITVIDQGDSNTFMMMCNNLTHEPMMLQAPEYEPRDQVDNTDYEAENSDRYTVDGITISMETEEHAIHYHTNMAALIQMGNWLDYLRANDVYDNTRIIIVSDHGAAIGQLEEFQYDAGGEEALDVTSYYPLLLVKDFNSTGFETCEDFMTNADVPTLATEGVIENPMNPFTGKAINAEEKHAHPQYISVAEDWHVETNNGNTFKATRWFSVEENIWDMDNWTYIEEVTTVPEY